MKPFNLLPVLSLAGLALGLDFSNWAPPGPNDFRAPCPAMNSIANHHFIQHDGRNITVPKLVQVMMDVFNLSKELATKVSDLGLLTADNPAGGVFTLDDLNKHNLFEHDASLSRCDLNICGDNHSFNQTIFDDFLSFFNDTDHITIERAAAARYHFVQKSRSENSQFTYDVLKQATSYGETIKYFRTMADPVTGLTPVRFVKILFEEQRLPFNEGWRTPSTEISGFSLTSDVLQLALNTNETYPFSTGPIATEPNTTCSTH